MIGRGIITRGMRGSGGVLLLVQLAGCGLLATLTASADDGSITPLDAGKVDGAVGDTGVSTDGVISDHGSGTDSASDAGVQRDAEPRDADADGNTIEAGAGVDGCSVATFQASGSLRPNGRIAIAADNLGATVAWVSVSGSEPHLYAFHVVDDRTHSGPLAISGIGAAPDRLALAASGTMRRAVWIDGYRMYSNALNLPDVPVNFGDLVLSSNSPASPAVARLGSDFGLAWIEFGGAAPALTFSLFSTAGALVGDAVTLASDNGLATPALASAGDTLGLVWSTTNSTFDTLILFTTVAASTLLVGPVACIYQGADATRCPAIAAAGVGEYGIVWRRSTETGSDDVVFARVVAGETLVSSVVASAAFAASCDNGPFVAWNDGEYGVSYVDAAAGSLHLLRLSPQGAPIAAPMPVPGIEAGSSTALAATGGDYLIAGTGWRYIRPVMGEPTAALTRIRCPR